MWAIRNPTKLHIDRYAGTRKNVGEHSIATYMSARGHAITSSCWLTRMPRQNVPLCSHASTETRRHAYNSGD